MMMDLHTSDGAKRDSAAACCGGGGGVGTLWRSQHHNNNNNNNNNNNVVAVDDPDVALAKEMNELSVQEREKVSDEIHGVAPIHEETPDFMAHSLEEMNLYLMIMPKPQRKALDRALFLKPSIDKDDKFKIMFLRADNYDPKQAAQRMARYFKEKLVLFGEDKLVKKITLDDLEEVDRERLNRVGCVVLPNKDQVGRPIWFFDVENVDADKNWESMHRRFWYQAMTTVLEDETAQLKGICDVAYCPGNLLAMSAFFKDIPQIFGKIGGMLAGLPCRISALQFCYDDTRMRYLLSHIGAAFGKNVRLRIRTHFGSDLELQYSLMTFGIVCHYLFRNNNYENNNHDDDDDDGNNNNTRDRLAKQHMQRRKDIEQAEKEARLIGESSSESSGIILHPQPNDVLVGRGRPYQEYPGNQRLSRLVEIQSNTYRNTQNRLQKSAIIRNVIKAVHDSNGRFIQKAGKDGSWWKIASEKAAREKTCSAFRFKVGKAIQNNDENTTSSQQRSQPVVSDDDHSTRSSKRLRYDSS